MKKVSKITLLKILRPFFKDIPTNQLIQMYRVLKNEKPHWFNNQVRINTFFPPFPSLPFERFSKIIINRRRAPYQIYLAVTSSCPYGCEHCSYGKRNSSQYSTKQILDLIYEMKKMGTSILGFTGGEPLLRSDIEKLVSAASPEMTTVIFTTGHNLDEARAKKLLAANVGCVILGMESANKEIHDKVRGNSGSFDEGINAIKVCNEVGIYTSIGFIATKDRIKRGEVKDIYELGQSLNVGEIRILSPVPTGSWIGRDDIMLSSKELQYLIEFHKKHNRSGDGPCIATFAHIESPEMFGCNAGYHHLFIDATGEVCPCDLTPLSFGNINDDSLETIWNSMEDYFPRPRLSCLMGEIGQNIKEKKLPVTVNKSKKLIPKIDKDTPLPNLYRRLLK